MLDGFGHLPEVEAPDIVNRLLRDFFANPYWVELRKTQHLQRVEDTLGHREEFDPTYKTAGRALPCRAQPSSTTAISRRVLIAGAAAEPCAAPAAPRSPQQPAPAPRAKGPLVWLDMDQKELDDAYDQAVYAPNAAQLHKRRERQQRAACARASARPQRFAYGPTADRDARHLSRPSARTRRSWSSSMAAPGAPGSAKDFADSGRAVRERRRAFRGARLHQCRSRPAAA